MKIIRRLFVLSRAERLIFMSSDRGGGQVHGCHYSLTISSVDCTNMGGNYHEVPIRARTAPSTNRVVDLLGEMGMISS
jgi:hypothetical protein